MNKKLKLIIMALLLIIMSIGLISCNLGDDPDDPILPDPGKGTVNRDALKSTLGDALALQRQENANANVLNVTSKYSLIVRGINYQFDYQANYLKGRDRDSELYLRIFDAQYYQNVLLVYYDGNDLYTQLDGKYTKYENFGSTSFFPTFFSLITQFDFNEFLASNDFKDILDLLITLCSDDNITSGNVAGNRKYIEIRDIILDTERQKINNTIKSTLGVFENKFDLITLKYMDLKISELAKLEVSTINGELLSIAMKDDMVNDISFKLNGKLSNNIDDYRIDFNLATLSERKDIVLLDIDNPALVEYELGNLNNYHYTGTFEIPLLDIVFKTDIKADLNSENNDTNRLLIRFSDAGVDQGTVYYENGVFYNDLTGIYNQLHGAIDLNYMNLPKIRVEDINLAQEMSSVMNIVLQVVNDMLAADYSSDRPFTLITELNEFLKKEENRNSLSPGQRLYVDDEEGYYYLVYDFDVELGESFTAQTFQEAVNSNQLIRKKNKFRAVVENMSSTNDTIEIIINKELISILTEEDINIVELIASKFGFSQELLALIFGNSTLDDAELSISYNLQTNEIILALVAEEVIILKFSLFKQDVLIENFVIEYPPNFNPLEYLLFREPTQVQYDMAGTIKVMGASEVDLSELFGVFLGDITGVNTPYILRSYDQLSIEISGSEAGGNAFMFIIKDITDEDNIKDVISVFAPFGDYIYIDFAHYGLKYKLPKSAIIESISDLLGEDNLFESASIADIFNALMRFSSTSVTPDSIRIALNPTANNDPVFNILGINNLSINLNANISFDIVPIIVNTQAFPEPELIFEDGLILEFNSMYDAVWITSAEVKFGSLVKEFNLSFIGESANFDLNKFIYSPAAKLLGFDISYKMVILDVVYGTKRIDYILDSHIVIDPADENPMPDKIGVVYEDGTTGMLDYIIDGFDPVAHIQLSGMSQRYYDVIIGKGAIGEVTFRIQVEVLNREIQPLNIQDNYRLNVPIVKEVIIDPYFYALMNLNASNPYNPLYETPLHIIFGSNSGQGATETILLEDFEWILDPSDPNWDPNWNFNLDSIDFNGNIGYVKGKFKTLEFGMKVIVKAKQVDYIKISGEANSSYTVDSLISSTYEIPTYSTPDREIRIYFNDFSYRIIGEPSNYQDIFNRDYNPTGDSRFDGYWPFELQWSNPVVNNITGVSAVNNPFIGVNNNITTTTFGITSGNYNFTIGNQKNINISVNVPSRTVDSPTYPTQAIIEYQIFEGDIIGATQQAVFPSNAAFPGYQIGEPYIFDPYDDTPLPNQIEIYVLHAGVLQRKSYPIIWQASSIINSEGRILHPNSDNVLLRVVGHIGDGVDRFGNPITQEIILIVNNLEASYVSIQLQGLPKNVVEMTIDPYAPFSLPTFFTLTFSEDESDAITFTADWKIVDNGTLIDVNNQTKFIAAGTNYKPSIQISTFIEKAEGVLAQEITLTLNILRRTVRPNLIGGIYKDQTQNIVIDSYHNDSKALYDKLVNGLEHINVFMTDGLMNYDYNNLPVVWNNMQDLIQLLESPLGGNVTLSGVIFSGENNAQTVTCNFTVYERLIENLNFRNIPEGDDRISVNYNIEDKIIDIELHKPFALTNELGANVLPYAYILNVLNEVSLIFKNGFYGDYNPVFDFGTEAEFNSLIYDDYLSFTMTTFIIDKLSGGSNLEGFTLNIKTWQDEPVTPLISKQVVLFNEDGSFAYPTGYAVSSMLDVQYVLSGKQTYRNVVWRTQLAIGDLPPDSIITHIPITGITMATGTSHILYTELPNGKQIQKSVNFQRANINDTIYDATANNPLYNISYGEIVINNIYEYKTFDISQIPSKIRPIASSNFVLDYPITFDIQWVFEDIDFSMIGASGMERTKIATARIYGHQSDYQDISLYLTVNPLENAEYNISEITVTHPSPGVNEIFIDPYVVSFEGNFVLPEDIILVFNDGAQYSYLNKYVDNFYYEYQGNIITNIEYDHLGHLLQGDNPNEATITLVLRDGNRVDIDIFFQDRTLVDIFIPNKVTKTQYVEGEYLIGNTRYVNLNRVYYIDPYDESTHAIPTSVYASFERGENIFIDNIVWETEDNFVITYDGKSYTFNSSLAGYGVAPQEFSVTVIVLNRSLINDYVSVHYFDDPIGGMVEDIANSVQAPDFVTLPQEYLVFGNPIIPYIDWYKGAQNAAGLQDNDIGTQGMPATLVTGNLIYGGFRGEQTEVTVTVSNWIFRGVYSDQLGEIPLANNRFLFNAFSGDTIPEYYFIKFEDMGTGDFIYVKFYSEKRVLTDEQKRHTIFWDNSIVLSFSNQVGKIDLGNQFKSQRITKLGYTYVYRQIVVSSIDIGYGNDVETGYPRYVIDPMNPVAPSYVEAFYEVTETIGGVPTVVEYSLGFIPAQWSSDVYNVFFAGGQRTSTISLNPFGDAPQIFNVLVLYLDRTPESCSSNLPYYSTQPDPINPGYYLFDYNNMIRGFINPINRDIYDEQKGQYILPATLLFTFKSSYSGAGADALNLALENYGYKMSLSEINWNFNGNVITLGGTPINNPLKMLIDTYKIQGYYNSDGYTQAPTNQLQSRSNILSVDFAVENKDIVETTISTALNVNMARDEFSIDPYNVVFPTSIGIRYRNEVLYDVYDNLVWSYNTSLLTNPNFINGSYGEQNMIINATIQIFAQSFNIDFKVIPRHINITNDQGIVQPLYGGTIFVLRGKPLLPQLPNSIYYHFVNPFNTSLTSWQEIPLVFDPLDLASINMNVVSAYNNIGAKMGIEYDQNIVFFRVEVVEPVLREYNSDQNQQGTNVYDYLSVAKTLNGIYTIGRESIILPEYLAIDSNRTINIVNINYDIPNNIAIINCLYSIVDTGAHSSLGGTNLTARAFSFVYTVPLRSYVYTYLDTPPTLTKTTHIHTLGQPLKQSDLPKAILNNEEYSLIWDMANVNIYRAGVYTIFGYYKNAFNEDNPLALNIVIEKVKITKSNVTIAPSWLSRQYSGSFVPVNMTVNTFLREDGSYGNIDYVIHYSNNEVSWFIDQPMMTGSYFMRITFNDYNVEGSLIYNFEITKQLISTVGFQNEVTGTNNMVYYYNGTIFSPIITGLPHGCLYSVVFVRGGIERILSDAGTYQMRLTILDQHNFYATQTFITDITILKANVVYDIVDEMIYNSTYRHVTVTGLPANIPQDMTVTYSYFDGSTYSSQPIKNVGTYYATVTINGGNNYPDAVRIKQFNIVKRDLVIRADLITIEYLEEFDNTFLLSHAIYDGLQANDPKSSLGVLLVDCNATSRSIIGYYDVEFRGLNHPNYNISYVPATLQILPGASGQTQVIDGAAELATAINNLNDGDAITWYLTAGEYGSIEINKNATVTLVGAYDQININEIGTKFNSITVNKGTLTLDIIKFTTTSEKRTSINIGEDTIEVRINRSEFNNPFVGEGPRLTNTIAIASNIRFEGALYLQSSKISGYAIAAYMPNGSIVVDSSIIQDNVQGLRIMNGNVTSYDTLYSFSSDTAIYIAKVNAVINISGNTFFANRYAISTMNANLFDPNNPVLLENTFNRNAVNLFRLF